MNKKNDENKSVNSNAYRIAFVILLVLPVLVIAGFVVLQLFETESKSEHDLFNDKDSNLRVLDKWLDGSTRTKVYEWPKSRDSLVKFCYYDPKGEHLGCGIEKNGKMWDGVQVEWYRYSRKDPLEREGYGVPQRIVEYKNGKPDGKWKTFFLTGQLNSVTDYDNGERLSTVIYDADGEVIGSMKAKAKQTGSIGRQ